MPAEDPTETTADAEAALADLYPRLLESERENVALRDQLAEAEVSIGELTEERDALLTVETTLSARVAELDEQIRKADQEIDALHNSRTMRAVAVPRRIYAAIRSNP